ncbi:MAG: hypothetical protein FJZ56_00755 [Chlamydiae bacterium]|nr:hypothetical protein [Chlamydiota bacterium]
MNELVLAVVISSLWFFVLTLMFGNFFGDMATMFQKPMTKTRRYITSTSFLLALFFYFRLLNGAFDKIKESIFLLFN